MPRPGSRFPASARTAGSICARASTAAIRARSASASTRRASFYSDLLILGSVVPEGLPVGAGRHPRVRRPHRRQERGSFHTIPHPGELGYDTWPTDAWKYSGGANAWSGVSLDESARPRLRGDRLGVVRLLRRQPARRQPVREHVLCLRAATGERVWHFQASSTTSGTATFPRRPSLVTITKDGRPRDVVAQTAKNGRTYVLDRETGAAVFPMETVTPPASDVPGERAAATQVLPDAAAALHAAAVHRGPDHQAHAGGRRRRSASSGSSLRKGGEFDPPSTQGTILFPGMDGGGEWGGAAFDPGVGPPLRQRERDGVDRSSWRSGKMPDGGRRDGQALYTRYCASCHRATRAGKPPEFPSLVDIGARRSVDEVAGIVHEGGGRMPAFAQLHGAAAPRDRAATSMSGESETVRADKPSPFDLRYSLDGYMRVHRSRRLPRDHAAVGHADRDRHEQGVDRLAGAARRGAGIGADEHGQRELRRPVVTASGLVFIGATNYDKKFRAFDAHTGQVLWETTLPAAGNATPAVYEVNGKQYVVIAAGGGKWGAPSGGTYVAFALP